MDAAGAALLVSGGGASASSPRSPRTGEPIGTCLDDGSSVELVRPPEILGKGGSGIVHAAVRTRRNGATERVACKMLLKVQFCSRFVPLFVSSFP